MNPRPGNRNLARARGIGTPWWRGAAELLLLAALPALLLAARDRGLPPEPGSNATMNPPGGESAEPGNGTVNAEQALAWSRSGQGVLWVDARTAAAFAREHVPGAALLNEDDWSALLPGVLERWAAGQRIVVYCDGGDCRASERVATRLRDAGLDSVHVLRGGWPAWQRASGALPAAGTTAK